MPTIEPADATDLRVVVGQLVRRLREQADTGDLTHSQSAVLSRLETHGPATMSALARAQGVRPQSMAAIVAALQQVGFVEGAPDPDDGRKTLLTLTDHARSLIGEGRIAKEDWLFRAITTTLEPDEQNDLAACIPLLRRLAQSP